MKNTIRTFLSLNTDLQKTQLNYLKGSKTDLQNENIRWGSPVNLHLTLRFLGKTTPQQIEKIKTSLMEVTISFSSSQLNLLQLNCFKSHGKSKAILVNTAESEALNILAKLIYLQIEKNGFGKELVNPCLI